LDVKEVEHDAPNWYRLRIDLYNLRILFRLLVRRGEDYIWLGRYELPIGDDKPFIDLTQAGDRSVVYGAQTRRRYRSITRR
jgi:hypothetical protein